MAEEENEALSLEDTDSPKGGSKKKLIIIIVAVVLLLAGGVAAYFLLSSDDSEVATEQIEEQQASTENTSKTFSATYVAMPRPFVFNVMEGKRDRLVQIKVQLMVRGSENAVLAKKHIPLLEGTLVRVFGAATVQQLRSPVGKTQLREYPHDENGDLPQDILWWSCRVFIGDADGDFDERSLHFYPELLSSGVNNGDWEEVRCSMKLDHAYQNHYDLDYDKIKYIRIRFFRWYKDKDIDVIDPEMDPGDHVLINNLYKYFRLQS